MVVLWHGLQSRAMNKTADAHDETVSAPSGTIFVIMPFRVTPTRSEADLTEFFLTNLKRRIETDDTLSIRYVVRRSDDTFNITEQIIRDLYEADVVLCDLSGRASNPNVMYELGVRLATTNKPVVLFREAAADNERIFDIQGFYAFEYRTTRYRELEDYIVGKLRKFESGAELYESPVLRVLRDAPSVVQQVKVDRVVSVLNLLAQSIRNAQFGVEYVVDAFIESSCGVDVKGATLPYLFGDETAQDLPWSQLRLRPRAAPGIYAFLSEPLLHGLVPEAQADEIYEFVASYYGRYFAEASVWDAPDSDQIVAYLTETAGLHLALRTLSRGLRADRDSQERLIAKAIDLLRSPEHELRKVFASLADTGGET